MADLVKIPNLVLDTPEEISSSDSSDDDQNDFLHMTSEPGHKTPTTQPTLSGSVDCYKHEPTQWI